ncbi:hypothetical protein PV762_14900 [Mitsuaria sp. CC2]|uniref:hypothetical protein n=1 Tax=Mitsuaria sp. CC2 TaxID=3029186 RepID=UPI003B8E658E
MDEITKRWFDVSMVQVHRAPELVGWYADEELIRLSGAPKGSRLEVAPISDGRIELRTINADLFSEPLVRAISQDKNGDYVFEIQNAAFVLRPQFRRLGIGTRSVAIELHEARRLAHFSKVWVSAVGDATSLEEPMAMVGYYAWARMGFNAPLPLDLSSHPSMPSAGRACSDLIGLLASSEGREFWRRFGRTLFMEFSLKKSSESWEHFLRYTKERNIEVTT